MENSSSDNVTTTTLHPETTSDEKQMSNFLWRYYIWLIFAFGIPGNLISFIVIIRMSRRGLSTPMFYVGLLAVVDTLSIIMKVTENHIRYNSIPMHGVSCKFLYFFGLTCAAYANWILIIMSAERFTAVKFPMKVVFLWSLKRAMIIITSVLFFLWLVHGHIFASVTSNDKGNCGRHPDFKDFFKPWWFVISTCIYAVIPALTLVVLNSLIIWVLRTSAAKRHDLISGNNPSFDESRRQERQVTIMLVTVSVVFVLLTIPRCVYLIVWNYWFPQDQLGKDRKNLFNAITSMMADSNHAVNFYLYFLSGRKFRKSFMQIIYGFFPCCQKRSDDNSTGITQEYDLPLTGAG